MSVESAGCLIALKFRFQHYVCLRCQMWGDRIPLISYSKVDMLKELAMVEDTVKVLEIRRLSCIRCMYFRHVVRVDDSQQIGEYVRRGHVGRISSRNKWLNNVKEDCDTLRLLLADRQTNLHRPGLTVELYSLRNCEVAAAWARRFINVVMALTENRKERITWISRWVHSFSSLLLRTYVKHWKQLIISVSFCDSKLTNTFRRGRWKFRSGNIDEHAFPVFCTLMTRNIVIPSIVIRALILFIQTLALYKSFTYLLTYLHQTLC